MIQNEKAPAFCRGLPFTVDSRLVALMMVVVTMTMVTMRSSIGRNCRNGQDGKGNSSEQNKTYFHDAELQLASVIYSNKSLFEAYSMSCWQTVFFFDVYQPWCASVELNQYFIAFDPHREDSNLFVGRIIRQSGFCVEGPGVPRTDDGIALHPALPQWALPMRTHVIQRR